MHPRHVLFMLKGNVSKGTLSVEQASTSHAVHAERENIRRRNLEEERVAATCAADAEHHRQARAEESIEEHEHRLRSIRRHRQATATRNIGRSSDTPNVEQHTCGSMNGCCRAVGGLFFNAEKNARGSS